MHELFSRPPVLGFAAWSGTGKTTLLERLLPRLREHGLRIGLIKHAHHDFDIDHPGKDSHRLRQAGAGQVLIASSRRWALLTETPEQDEADLTQLIGQLDRNALDLILVEGFRHERFPKLELHRAATGRPLLYPDDDSIMAVLSDAVLDTALPQLDINDIPAITAFILDYVRTT
ncbi:MAG: molybdopterin-guanine dinucleotide biosynthesis protein B [Gammaproteobacteria bacterium]|nr:molybdopterin-guanine dinucleotide biosynthesis protein B [Gammaproteobacteria bacterium]